MDNDSCGGDPGGREGGGGAHLQGEACLVDSRSCVAVGDGNRLKDAQIGGLDVVPQRRSSMPSVDKHSGGSRPICIVGLACLSVQWARPAIKGQPC